MCENTYIKLKPEVWGVVVISNEEEMASSVLVKAHSSFCKIRSAHE